MLEFEIKSTTPEFNFKRVINKNAVYIGKNKGDICIPIDSFRDSILYIEILGNDVLVHPDPQLDYFLLNGKRSTKIKKIKPGDRIQYDIIEFTLISAVEIPLVDYQEEINRKRKDWEKQNHPLLATYLELKNEVSNE